MRIGILIVATGKYISFFDPLYDDIMRYFLPFHEKQIFIFTDAIDHEFAENVVVTKIKKGGFPSDTLYRYHYFLRRTNDLLMTTDVLYYIDADSRIICEIGDQILPNSDTPLIGCIHPGFWNTARNTGTPETRTVSTAYIDPTIQRQFYWCGGLNGGFTFDFLQMSLVIANNINIDDKNNIIATWHDESHINKYFVKNQKKVKSLSPSYMFPEPFERWTNLKDLKPKIVAISKNHKEIRS